MLRPKRMSKVSVTGSKAVMAEVVETVHEFHAVHLNDYDGSWEGFDNGDPIEGAEEASEKLVTIRALENILDIEESNAGAVRELDEAEIDERLEDVRSEVNELGDRRDEIREELRQVEEELDRMEPFAALGIDLDLLQGYDSIDVAVGETDEADLRNALEASDAVAGFETFSGDGVVAVAVYPAEGIEDPLSDALVGVDFPRVEVPETDQSPDEYVEDLGSRRQTLQSNLSTVENELQDVKHDVAGFLLAAEEQLSVQVERAEAPLRFATTERSFVSEGWIPSEEYDAFVEDVRAAVGDRVEIEELERAEYDRHGDVLHEEPGGGDAAENEDAESPSETDVGPEEEGEQPTAADGGKKVKTDGGAVTMEGGEEPPVVQDNGPMAQPFEVLVKAVSRPKYSEFDPTYLLLLTFPLFFGFMISDVGYGLLYVLIGYYLWQGFDSPGIKSLGGVGMWAGIFTMFFGVLFGEFFGMHGLGYTVFEPIYGDGHSALRLGGEMAIAKGLSPATSEFALLWLVISVFFGLAHLLLGYTLDFVQQVRHNLWHAITESASWILMLAGIWTWVFSYDPGSIVVSGYDLTASGTKPESLIGPESVMSTYLLFDGFPAVVGVIGLAVFAVGFVLLAIGEPIEIIESLQVFVHTLSYARILAVLLAKGGMAFVVNLLAFGVYEQDGSRSFMFAGESAPEGASVMFEGLFNMGPIAFVGGVVVLVVGHLIVLALGITSAGLQGVRLEYVEFFGKFYEGGGKNYEPFGYDRQYTTDND